MEITQELVKSLFEYSDGFLYWKVRPAMSVNIGDKAGRLNKSKSGNRYQIGIKGKQYYSSRLIFLWHKGWMPINVDHENHIKTDDRINNLRAASRAQNSQNRMSLSGSTSKYLGVVLHKRDKNWQGGIFVEGKTKYLGYFKTEASAALAYNRAAVMYFGEFANLNIIQP